MSMEDVDAIEAWKPRTSLGRKVKEGEITDFSQILRSGRRPREIEIIDKLLPDLDEEILEVRLVQRMHRSGRRIKFRVLSVVGNGDGIVGVGHASGGEVGPSIRKSIIAAKMNVIEIARGCGSWECGCDIPHSIPFEVSGGKGSVRVTLKPAPRGLGLAAAEVPRLILEKAGIEDAWTHSEGQTRTTINFGLATFDALKCTAEMAISDSHRKKVVMGIEGSGSD